MFTHPEDGIGIRALSFDEVVGSLLSVEDFNCEKYCKTFFVSGMYQRGLANLAVCVCCGDSCNEGASRAEWFSF